MPAITFGDVVTYRKGGFNTNRDGWHARAGNAEPRADLACPDNLLDLGISQLLLPAADKAGDILLLRIAVNCLRYRKAVAICIFPPIRLSEDGGVFGKFYSSHGEFFISSWTETIIAVRPLV